eukprot:9230609-Pyramimonas_sp.AAC.1
MAPSAWRPALSGHLRAAQSFARRHGSQRVARRSPACPPCHVKRALESLARASGRPSSLQTPS